MTDLFAIPAHLRREKGDVAIKRREPRRARFSLPAAPFDRRPPKSMKGATKVAVHLNDDAPRIGSGHRLVWAKPGRKWVHIADADGNRGKLCVDTFRQVIRGDKL